MATDDYEHEDEHEDDFQGNEVTNMNQMPVMPGTPFLPKGKPPSRGERVAILVEDILIVVAVVFLLCWVIFRLRGPVWMGLMFAALVAMIVVFVARFLRIKHADKAGEDGEDRKTDNEKPGS